MSMEKHKKLITLLVKKTEAGELDWKPTATENAFVVSFSRSSIILEETQGATGLDYHVSLLNAGGDTAETFSDVDLDSTEDFIDTEQRWYHTMKSLFATARRTAHGSERVLNEILSELEDDIPF